ncbi:MAG TPA: MacB family efflux pump subunit [Alphaproteobacteria bacterium]
MEPLLVLQKIQKYYQAGDTTVKALDGVDLKIWPGEFVAIMGQSGSGKSTLMNIIGCLDHPTGGSYHVRGEEAGYLEPDDLAALRRETFGFVFQRYNLLANGTAMDNVEIPAVYAGLGKAERRKRAAELLTQLGLESRRFNSPSQLSGGQQQRVAIARALMNDPPVILADEPTGALDSATGIEVMNLLKNLHAQGRTIILITHDEHVASHADRIINIQDGRILSDSHPQGALPAGPPPAITSQYGESNLLQEIGESVKMALQSLHVNIFRTALTLLGIVIGVAAVITMLAIGNGSKQQVLDQISAMGTNLLSVRPGAPGLRGAGDVATMTPQDADAILQLPNVRAVLPERSGRYTVRIGNKDYMTTVQGMGASMPQVRDWAVAKGHFFTENDLRSYAPVVVLGQTVIDQLFQDADPLGQYVLIKNVPFEVIGVLERKGAAMWGGDQDDAVFVPITTGLIRLFGMNYVNAITVQVDQLSQLDATQAAITELLKDRHRAEDFSARNMASIIDMVSATQNTLTILLGAVAAISLLVGGIGVMNIMLVSVTERTREIGVRMATGARQRNILVQFNTEAAVVCIVGGLVGIALGMSMALGLNMFDIQTVITPGPAIIAFTSAFLTGLLFGYLPARKAARLDPVIALSSE